MKKTLSTILLGASLFLGAENKTKAQEVSEPNIYYDFINKDQDSFSEEVYGIREEGLNKEKNLYITNKMGLTIIYYKDKDNDNFHESIKIFNCNKIRNLIIEDFNINKETGLINYEYKIYFLTKKKWSKYFAYMPFLNIVKEEQENNLNCQRREYYPGLTKEQIYNLYPGFCTFNGRFGERVKNLINASKSSDELKSMLKEERYRWVNTSK